MIHLSSHSVTPDFQTRHMGTIRVSFPNKLTEYVDPKVARIDFDSAEEGGAGIAPDDRARYEIQRRVHRRKAWSE
jgi:hypothetical protein